MDTHSAIVTNRQFHIEGTDTNEPRARDCRPKLWDKPFTFNEVLRTELWRIRDAGNR